MNKQVQGKIRNLSLIRKKVGKHGRLPTPAEILVYIKF